MMKRRDTLFLLDNFRKEQGRMVKEFAIVISTPWLVTEIDFGGAVDVPCRIAPARR